MNFTAYSDRSCFDLAEMDLGVERDDIWSGKNLNRIKFVIPAKAGIAFDKVKRSKRIVIPAFAGMTYQSVVIS